VELVLEHCFALTADQTGFDDLETLVRAVGYLIVAVSHLDVGEFIYAVVLKLNKRFELVTEFETILVK